jgi:hypothetical protein
VGTQAAQASGARADALAVAHARLVADVDYQWVLPAYKVEAPPAWLAWLGKLLGTLASSPMLFWTMVALVAALVILSVVRSWLAAGRPLARWPFGRKSAEAAPASDPEAWRPEPAPARALLHEADALAQAGRFAEAVHLLLQRSIEDLRRQRPQLVQPSLTSRELAGAEAMPRQARDVFARIAALVERSLFGGTALDAVDWKAARAAYADFAMPGRWA